MKPHRIDTILNRELAKYFVGCPKVDRLTCVAPPGQDIVAKDASDATKIGVHLVEAQYCLDADTSLSLSLPSEDTGCHWPWKQAGTTGPTHTKLQGVPRAQFVHESHEELGMFRGIEEHDQKHKREIILQYAAKRLTLSLQ